MNKSFNKDFKESLLTGFFDKSIESEILCQPELLVNRKIPRKKVLSTIVKELETCEKFYISVAFVTTSGVAALINTLKILESRGVKGKIGAEAVPHDVRQMNQESSTIEVFIYYVYT